jgi:hypothetical protein
VRPQYAKKKEEKGRLVFPPQKSKEMPAPAKPAKPGFAKATETEITITLTAVAGETTK